MCIWKWDKKLKKVAIRTENTKLRAKDNKRQLQTLSIDNAWSNKSFLYYLTFRMLQHTSLEVTINAIIQTVRASTNETIRLTITIFCQQLNVIDDQKRSSVRRVVDN